MRCLACKRPATARCACGAAFCEEVTVSEHTDYRTGQRHVTRYVCMDLHHCVRGISEAIDRMTRVRGKTVR